MGFGTGPFGSELGFPQPGPGPEVVSDLSSSRMIDGNTKRYVTDDLGGFEPMDDTDQRVLLLVCFALIETKFITPQELASQEAQIRTALSVLTDGKAPVIKLLTVSATQSGPGSVSTTVEYMNLKTNTKRTVRA